MGSVQCQNVRVRRKKEFKSNNKYRIRMMKKVTVC